MGRELCFVKANNQVVPSGVLRGHISLQDPEFLSNARMPDFIREVIGLRQRSVQW